MTKNKIQEVPYDNALLYSARNFHRLPSVIDKPHRLPMFLPEWLTSPKRHRLAQRSQRMLRGKADKLEHANFLPVARAAYGAVHDTPWESQVCGEIALAFLGSFDAEEAHAWAVKSIASARREEPPITAVLVCMSLNIDNPYPKEVYP